MASISFSGLGSGIDTGAIVDTLVAAERDPAEARLDFDEANAQANLSSFGNLKSSLSSLQGAISGLTTTASFNRRSATVANTDLFTAATNSLAEPGSFSVKVNTLAAAQSLATDADSAFEDLTDAIGTGTLSFEFGTFSGGTFTADPDKAAESVTIAAEDNTVQGVRDAINNANIGVTASIINDGNGFRLLISSEESGLSNTLKITVSDDSEGTDTDTNGLSLLAYDPEAAVDDGQNLTQTVAAADASVDINGLNVTRSSNTVTGAIDGVTLTLRDTSASATTLTVSNDITAVSESIGSFIENFNAYATFIDAATGFNADTQTGGILIGDSTVRAVDSGVRNLLSQTFGNATQNSLAQIGITTNDDGTLNIDTTKVGTALQTDFDGVTSLFAATGQPSDSFTNFVSFGANTQEGNYDVVIDQLATRGNFQGETGVTNVTLGATNKSFSFTVNGVSTDTIELTEGVYDDNAELSSLAAEIQSKINADENLQAQGISVTASYDSATSRFVITSSEFGSGSSVAINSQNNDLGLTTSGVATSGVDVSGTIGGVAATGSGQLLLASGNAAGLVIEITSGNTGARGSVNFTRGVADRLNTLIGNFLDDDGLVESRISGFENDIEEVAVERDALGRRITQLEARLLRQYTALDSLVASLQATSEFLTQQLDALPSINIGGRN